MLDPNRAWSLASTCTEPQICIRGGGFGTFIAMNHYRDPHALYDFLKGIASIDEFFARKEPAFDDALSREIAKAQIELGSDPGSVLSALKCHERQSYAQGLTQRKAPH